MRQEKHGARQRGPGYLKMGHVIIAKTPADSYQLEGAADGVETIVTTHTHTRIRITVTSQEYPSIMALLTVLTITVELVIASYFQIIVTLTLRLFQSPTSKPRTMCSLKDF